MTMTNSNKFLLLIGGLVAGYFAYDAYQKDQAKKKLAKMSPAQALETITTNSPTVGIGTKTVVVSQPSDGTIDLTKLPACEVAFPADQGINQVMWPVYRLGGKCV